MNDPLWNKIKKYRIADTNASLTFSDRLARENGWSQKYTQRAILEYKRFIYMICIQPDTLSPSDEVDQVWHLHLIYTQDYWEDFCEGILQKRIHHGPTKGGQTEKNKFEDIYSHTLALYQETFGKKPPEDIWPPTALRFRKIHYIRIAKNDYFIFPKNIFKKLTAWI